MSFTSAARRRDQTLGNIPYDGGQRIPRRLQLRNSGYLERLRLVVNSTGAYVTAGPTGVDAFGQFSGPVDRITVVANSVGNLYDVSGFGTAVIAALDAQYNYGTPFTFVPFGQNFTPTPALVAFSNNWVYDIPIALNLANKPYPMGLFQTALNSQEVSLEVRFLPIAGVVGSPGSGVYTGNPANLTIPGGNVTVQQAYYDPIAKPEDQPSLGYIHQWREFQFPISADGDAQVELPPSNFYTRIIYVVVTGGPGALVPTTVPVTRLQLVYGANLAPYDETIGEARARQGRTYGLAATDTTVAGILVHDFLEESHTERDTINSAATTDLRAVLTFSGGVYSGGAYVKVIAEQMIPLGAPVVGTAGVQGVAT